MNRTHRWAGLAAATALLALAAAPAQAANAPDCPNGGVVRFGVEPYDTSAKLVPDLRPHRQGPRRQTRLRGEGLSSPPPTTPRSRQCAWASWRSANSAPRLRPGAPGRQGRGRRRVRQQGRQARQLLGEPGHLARLRHQDGGGDPRPLLRLLRPRLHFRPPVPGLWPAQGRHRSRQGHPADLRRQPHLLLRGALQPQGRCGRAEQRAATIRHPARPLQGRRRRLPVEVRANTDRPDHRARRPARRLQGPPDRGAADPRPARCCPRRTARSWAWAATTSCRRPTPHTTAFATW